MPKSRRRVLIRPPTSTSIGFGTPVPRPYSGLGADCSVRFPGFFDVAPLIRCAPAFSVTADRNTVPGRWSPLNRRNDNSLTSMVRIAIEIAEDWLGHPLQET